MNRLKQHQVSKELEDIQKNDERGLLTAQAVVDAARDEESVLHGCFTWDDTLAAERFRLGQARTLIRTVVTHEARTNEPIRSFVSLPSDRRQPGGGYRALSVVVSIDSLKQEKLTELQRTIDREMERYAALLNMEPAFIEMRKMVPRFNEKRGGGAQRSAGL